MNLLKNPKLIKYLLAKEYIGGLEINDSFLHFFLFDPHDPNKVIFNYEAEIEEGVVVEGVLKKPEILKQILLTIRRQPSLKKIKHLYVILTLPSNIVYNKIFDLPTVDYKSVMSAVELNMKMFSPIPFEKVYSDWEIMEKPIKSDSFKLRVFSVFAEKNIIDPYISVLNEVKIIPLATEFSALSLWRTFSHYDIFKQEDKNYLSVYINSNGLEFFIGNKRGIEFNFYQTWKDALHSLGGEEGKPLVLTQENFIKIFSDLLQKVITFYFTRFQEPIEKVILLTPIYFEQLKSIIENKFNLMVENPTERIKQTTPAQFVALGAALRGLIPRADDVSVSLMAIGTEQEYRLSRTINFVNFWLKAIAEVLLIILIVTIGFNVFLNYSKKTALADREMISSNFNPAQLQELNQKAEEFNSAVEKAVEAKSYVKDWSAVFNYFYSAAKDNNIFTKSWVIPGPEITFSYNGSTSNQSSMLKFRDQLLESGHFLDLEIPLQSILQQKNQVEFNLKGKIKL